MAVVSFRLTGWRGQLVTLTKDTIIVADQKNQKPGLVKKNWRHIPRNYALKITLWS